VDGLLFSALSGLFAAERDAREVLGRNLARWLGNGIDSIILFGSRARGSARDGSDTDRSALERNPLSVAQGFRQNGSELVIMSKTFSRWRGCVTQSIQVNASAFR
jgi:hypothetical protein